MTNTTVISAVFGCVFNVMSRVAEWVPPGWMLPQESWCDWSLGVRNARTWVLWGKARACLAYVSCPTCANWAWCVLRTCRASVRLHSRIWTFLPFGCGPWLVCIVHLCYWVIFCTTYLQTCQGIRRGAWNAMLPQDWGFGSRRSCTQICPWTFWGTRRLLVTNWPRQSRSCGETC